MQLIIMDSRLCRSRTIHLTGSRLMAAMLAASLVLMAVAALLYHLVFLKGAREGWPVVGSLVRLVVEVESQKENQHQLLSVVVVAVRQIPNLVD